MKITDTHNKPSEGRKLEVFLSGFGSEFNQGFISKNIIIFFHSLKE